MGKRREKIAKDPKYKVQGREDPRVDTVRPQGNQGRPGKSHPRTMKRDSWKNDRDRTAENRGEKDSMGPGFEDLEMTR